MASERARAGAESPIGTSREFLDKESEIRRKMEDIMLIQEQLGKVQIEIFKRQEELDKRESEIETRRRELARRERRLEIGGEENQKSDDEYSGDFRGFERTRTPVDSFITVSRTPGVSRGGSPRPVPARRRSITPVDDMDKYNSEINRLRRENELLRSTLASSRPPTPQPRSGCPSIKIREITEGVPKFDGHNISVNQFARACKRALDSLPENYSDELENSLTRSLISKLSGHAYVVIEHIKVTRVEQLIERLKDAFLPSYGANYYRGQLATEFKKPGEHVLDYFSRIRDLTQSIIDEESKQLGRLERSVERKIEEEGLDAFIRGLSPEYRTSLRFEKYHDFSSALVCLLKIDKQIQADAARNKLSVVKDSNPKVRVIRQVVVCNFCGKRGHSENYCWKKNSKGKDRSEPSGSRSNSPRNVRGSFRKRCNYCKNFGHLKADCRKLKYIENKRMAGNGEGKPATDARRVPPPGPRPPSPTAKAGPSTSGK